MVKKKEKRRNSWLIFLIIILSLVIVANVNSLYRMLSIIEVKELEASLIISDIAGFDLNKTALTFGAIIPGSSATRIISMENNYEFPMEVFIYGKGEVRQFIIPGREVIGAGEKRKIGVTVRAADNAKFGNYTGKVLIEIRKL